MNSYHLFVGGPRDGERWPVERKVRHDLVHQVSVMEPLGITDGLATSMIPEPREVKIFTYKAHLFRADREEMFIFAPYDWDGSRVLKKLVLGYAKKGDLG